MKAELIDPRDETLQVADPTYRVYFWAEGGEAKEEWELSGTDLDEVLEWIPSHSLEERLMRRDSATDTMRLSWH
ncbi:hypothetical protein [Pseudarthrobacter sp. 1C304]|uniref:hypothetical protein n=1 Tax=Pseudarthrobacter sp. 1C304 TaxID=3457438 RepID=UPI003FCF95AE